MKKLFVVLMVVMMVLSSCNGKSETKTPQETTEATVEVVKVGFVTSEAGLGDQAFNDACFAGVKAAEAKLDHLELTVIEPDDASQLETSIRTMAREGNELVIAGASNFGDAVRTVAMEFPDTLFVIVDGDIDDYDNVLSVTSKEEEAAFLTGAFAKLYAGDGNKIGFIGGMDIPVIKKFEIGFIEGAKAVGADDEDILVSYTGVFNDTSLGKQTAEAQYANGATVIFSAAGACNLGMFEAAEVNGFTALGAATGQFDKSDAIVASHVKSVDTLLENLVMMFASDTPLGMGIVKYGLEEGGVDFRYNPGNAENGVEVPGDIIVQIDELRDQIINGEIDVTSMLNQ